MTRHRAPAAVLAALVLAAPSAALACRSAEFQQSVFRPADAPVTLHTMVLRVRIAEVFDEPHGGRPAVMADVLEVRVGELDAPRVELFVHVTSCGPRLPAVGDEGWIAVRTTTLGGDPPRLILDTFSPSELNQRQPG